jgi:hypothetical protein
MKFNIIGMVFYSLIFISLLCIHFVNNERNTSNYVEIPFVFEDKRIIVESIINGKKGRFIFDTGTTESYIDIKTINLSRAGYCITPYNGQQISVPYYNLNKITFGSTKIATHSWVVNRSDFITKSKKEGYDGILGSMIFEGYWCELSFSKNKIVLHKEKPDYFTSFSEVKILSKYDADFFIPSVIDGETYYFDIDTGAPAGIYFPGGLAKKENREGYQEVITTDTEPSIYYLVKTGSIHILDETYTNCFAMTNSPYSVRNDSAYNNLGILGVDFLKYYDFLFDYRELRNGRSTGMYYMPNIQVEKRDYGIYNFIYKVPEFGVLNSRGFNKSGFVIHRIIKDSIAYEIFGLRPGMTITKINGMPISEISHHDIFDPQFYLGVDSYTVLKNNIEQTVHSPLKSITYAVPSADRCK